tara:strand:+ start:405 stop:677 length:273 start_codon:yes stop_codon:yes gene_type:complete
MKRDDILKTAMKLINGKRSKDYGDAYDNHQRIADLWSVVFGFKVLVWQVYLCLILVKVARLVNSPKHLDSMIDIPGYAALLGETIDKDDK